jgi:hypothetical protein
MWTVTEQCGHFINYLIRFVIVGILWLNTGFADGSIQFALPFVFRPTCDRYFKKSLPFQDNSTIWLG